MKVWRTRDGEDGRAGRAFQFERLTVRVTRWRVVLAGVGVGAYALGLVAMAPSEIIVARSSNGERQAVGTVWAGERAMPGGFGAGWTLMPLSSILHLSAATRITLRGPDTEASTQVLARPGRVLIRDLEGTVSMRMLNAVAPGLPFACSPVMRLEVEGLALKGAPTGAGRILGGSGECAATGGAATPIAPLTGTLTADEGASNVVFTRVGATEPVLMARIQSDGTLTASVEPGGVGLLPGIGAPMSIDTKL